LPASDEEAVSGDLRGLLSGDGREGEEGEEKEEDDGSARPHPARLEVLGHEVLRRPLGLGQRGRGVAGLQEVMCRVVRGKAGVEGLSFRRVCAADARALPPALDFSPRRHLLCASSVL
jgi:hypothetical protein